MRTRKLLPFLWGLVLVWGLTACGTGEQPVPASDAKSETVTEAVELETAEETEEVMDVSAEQVSEPAEIQSETESSSAEMENRSNVLVVVFSATGTTKGVADKIVAIENADLYEILASEPYTDDDLNWHDSNSRTTKEQNDSSVRPGIASETMDLSGYSKIYVGYPIWWGEEPRIMDTFVESYDFGDATMIPFCTSSSSGIGRSGRNLAENAGSGNWLDGARFGSGVSEEELQSWINGLN